MQILLDIKLKAPCRAFLGLPRSFAREGKKAYLVGHNALLQMFINKVEQCRGFARAWGPEDPEH